MKTPHGYVRECVTPPPERCQDRTRCPHAGPGPSLIALFQTLERACLVDHSRTGRSSSDTIIISSLSLLELIVQDLSYPHHSRRRIQRCRGREGPSSHSVIFLAPSEPDPRFRTEVVLLWSGGWRLSFSYFLLLLWTLFLWTLFWGEERDVRPVQECPATSRAE